MQRPSFPRSKRTRVISLSSIAAGVAALVAAGAIVTTSSAADKPTPTPTPVTPTATVSPTPERTPPLIIIEKPTPEPQPQAKTLPLGPIVAEPARVYTGDGDCLNVRPQPGLKDADPRFCVPEGHLLWFYGEPVSADGETWRYALGTGWVAARYTKPDLTAAAKPIAGGFSAVVVYGDLYNNGSGIPAARVDLTKATTSGLQSVPYIAQGIGARPPYTSSDGRYAAYATFGANLPTLTIRTLANGGEVTIPGAFPVAWSGEGRLLINIGDCANGCRYQPGWLEPGDSTVHKFNVDADNGSAPAWAADGRAVFYSPYPPGGKGGAPVKRLWLDGRIDTIVAALPEGVYAGEMTASLDGRSLLLGSATGPIRTLDIATGALREFARAPQLPVLGRCGGASGKLSGWLDPTHIVYHESYAASGGNGITIGDVAGGSRRVLPFWSIQELTVVAPHTLSFSTWEGVNDTSFQLSWLLDTDSGVARPVAVGSAPTWIK